MLAALCIISGPILACAESQSSVRSEEADVAGRLAQISQGTLILRAADGTRRVFAWPVSGKYHNTDGTSGQIKTLRHGVYVRGWLDTSPAGARLSVNRLQYLEIFSEDPGDRPPQGNKWQ